VTRISGGDSLSASAIDTESEGDFIPLPPFIINERNDAYVDAGLAVQFGLTMLDPSGFSSQFSLPGLSVSCLNRQMDAIGRTGCAAGDIYQGHLVRTFDLTGSTSGCG
jgi:hypothetical protein